LGCRRDGRERGTEQGRGYEAPRSHRRAIPPDPSWLFGHSELLEFWRLTSRYGGRAVRDAASRHFLFPTRTPFRPRHHHTLETPGGDPERLTKRVPKPSRQQDRKSTRLNSSHVK